MAGEVAGGVVVVVELGGAGDVNVGEVVVIIFLLLRILVFVVEEALLLVAPTACEYEGGRIRGCCC